jgi:hypothetical protein
MKTIFLDIDETCVHSFNSRQFDLIIKDKDSCGVEKNFRKSIIEHYEQVKDEILELDVDMGYTVVPRKGLKEFLGKFSDCNIYVLSSAAFGGYHEHISPHFNIPAKKIISIRDIESYGAAGKIAGIFDIEKKEFTSNNWCLIDDQLPYSESLGIKFHTIGVHFNMYRQDFGNDAFQFVHVDPWYGGWDNGDRTISSWKTHAAINMYLTID